MKKNRLIFFLFFCILLVSLVNADWLEDGTCQMNTDCILSVKVVNDTTNLDFSHATCNITIYNISNSLLISSNMTNSSSGFYNYTINMNETGRYPSFVYCEHNQNATDMAEVTFVISDPNYNNYLYLLLLIIPIILFIIGKQVDDSTFINLAGVILICYGLAVYTGQFPRFESNLITDAFSLILLGIGFYMLLYKVIHENLLGG